MKIDIRNSSLQEVLQIPVPKRHRPVRPSFLFRLILRIFAIIQLWSTGFSYTKHNMEKLDEPCLILMNHSSFIDVGIASRILFPKPFNIVVTLDSLVGLYGLKGWAMLRLLGCIPTKKFISDTRLINDMHYALKEKRSNVLMFPEAGYSFDGRTTTLPRHLGILLKRLDVPVVMITTYGAFARDPLYNCLQKRRVPVSAKAELLLDRETIKNSSVDELDSIIDKAFAFDNFTWQQQNRIEISEPFRADGLHRIIYKCAVCGVENKMHGSGTALTCHACGKKYELDIYGYMQAEDGRTEFQHIPDWYNWQRQEVRKEIEAGEYSLESDVDIYVLADHRALYKIGDGHLKHDDKGFELTGCNGELHFEQAAKAGYTVNADYFWYEIGDVIALGNQKRVFYCFPKQKDFSVTKVRLAAEELFKLIQEEKKLRKAKK